MSIQPEVTRLELACGADHGFVPHSAAMLHSVLSHGGVGEVRVHYLRGADVTAEDEARLEGMVRELGGEISFLQVTDPRASALPTTHLYPTNHWYRIFLPELLISLDKVLYLDADTLVLDSLAPLWETDLGDHYLAAVTNVLQADHFHRPAELGMDDPGLYFNSGVMLLNLAEMRRGGITDRIIEWAGANPQLDWPEQDAMNVAMAGRRLKLHPRWNCMHSVLRFPWAAYAFGYEAIEEARRKPAIRHYEGPLMNKPWHFLAEPEASEPYFAHRRETPWPEVAPEGATPRNRLRRLRRRLSA